MSEVHVVFHLVTDPSLSITDIAARHPVMVGLRNCLHAASHHDIHTITIPLLMVHKMSPVSSYIYVVIHTIHAVIFKGIQKLVKFLSKLFVRINSMEP